MNRKFAGFTVLAIWLLLCALPVSAQTVQHALVYSDQTPELQSALSAYTDELGLEGVTVQITTDAADFGNQIQAAAFDAYAAFGTNEALLNSWMAQAPDNSQFLKVTPTSDGEIQAEYRSFIAPASGRGVTIGRTVTGVTNENGFQIKSESDYSTSTFDGRLKHIESKSTESSLGWPWRGIVDSAIDLFTGWLEDILNWLQCIADCAQGCINDFLDAIPEGVEVTITVEVQTTPPGVKTSISVKASGQAAVQVMRAYATLLKCIGECASNCTLSSAGNA